MVWRITDKLIEIGERMEWIQGSASTAYVNGSLLKMSSALPVALAAQTDQPYALYQSLDPQPYNGENSYNVNGKNLSPLRPAAADTTTALGEKIGTIPIFPGLVLDTDFTPSLSRVAAQSNSTAGQAICAYGGSTGDFTAGVVYLPDQDWAGIITSSAVSGGNVTLVFTPAAPRACTTGDVVCALMYGPGAAPKFDVTNPQLTLSNCVGSNAVGDKSGGNVLVRKVKWGGSPRGSVVTVFVQTKLPVD